MKKVVILGSTGSIGTSALDVIRHHPDQFKVIGLVAGSHSPKLVKQIEEFQPKWVAWKEQGEAAMIEVATLPQADIVLSAIVGVAGLKPTYAALQAGKTVALANKESLVAAGPVMHRAWREGKGELIPVDSEHSAIHQVLSDKKESVARIILTASGGPFRQKSHAELMKVTPSQALQHPNWKMGDKITIDSATLMNKGLEMIEAHWLFNLPPQKIEVVIHPQSIIHSLVEYVDGSVLAQLGLPDMRIPIAYALAYPERITTPAPQLHLTELPPLTFEPPDRQKFPALRLAKEALAKGQSYPCVLNAANEAAVAAFLTERIPFLKISQIVEEVLNQHRPTAFQTIEDVLAIDRWARNQAQTYIL